MSAGNTLLRDYTLVNTDLAQFSLYTANESTVLHATSQLANIALATSATCISKTEVGGLRGHSGGPTYIHLLP